MGPVYATSSEGASMAPSEPQGRLRGRSPRSKSRESDAPLRARLHPRLRPRQTRARPLTVAAHLRPRPAGGEASVQLALGEERVARPRGAPEHAPVAEAVGLGLAAVVAQTDERVLAGHQDVAGIDGRRHVAATSTRASLKHAPSEMSA